MADIPAKATLKRYGLTVEEWVELHQRAGGICEICRATTRRLCIDHEHVKGWRKMKPERRREYVRGLVCWRCNVSIIGRGITLEKLHAAARYLTRYEVGYPP